MRTSMISDMVNKGNKLLLTSVDKQVYIGQIMSPLISYLFHWFQLLI
jgi:hypothetical protein